MICSHAGCSDTALVQWRREATEAESVDHTNIANAARAAQTDVRRAQQRLAIAEVEDLKSHSESREEVERLTSMQGTLRRELDAIPDAVPLQPRKSTVAVFACHEHAVDADKASHVHQAGCAVGDCACDSIPPEATVAEPALIHPALAAKGW